MPFPVHTFVLLRNFAVGGIAIDFDIGCPHRPRTVESPLQS